jgi:hypothetical protein
MEDHAAWAMEDALREGVQEETGSDDTLSWSLLAFLPAFEADKSSHNEAPRISDPGRE